MFSWRSRLTPLNWSPVSRSCLLPLSLFIHTYIDLCSSFITDKLVSASDIDDEIVRPHASALVEKQERKKRGNVEAESADTKL